MSDTIWIVNMTGSDGAWHAHSWQDVSDDVLNACTATVDDCEQEINEGGFFASEEIRQQLADELYHDTMTKVERELAAHNGQAYVTVDPWYAVNQRCTFVISIRKTTEEEAYRA